MKAENDVLLSRKQLAKRWGHESVEPIKRAEREGKVRKIILNPRVVRYRLSEILILEKEGEVGSAHSIT